MAVMLLTLTGNNSDNFLRLLYSVSENGSYVAFTSEICMVFMHLILMNNNSQAQNGRLVKEEGSLGTYTNSMTSHTETYTSMRH
jgi:hypothetical protein